tara:strand:+ start:124 stop:612 length:489 start_codon:yes stop_codon:yes gene_type:complete
MSEADAATRLKATIQLAARMLSACQDPWWIYGSAALALYGVPDIAPADLDILVSERDFAQLSEGHGWVNSSDGGTEIFRSTAFTRMEDTPLPVEVMAGMELRQAGMWWGPFRFETRQQLSRYSVEIFVPALQELRQTLLRFGRLKDLARVTLIDRYLSEREA